MKIKKIISLLVAAVIAVTTLPVASFAEDGDLRIIVGSDFEYTFPDNEIVNGSTMFGYAQDRASMFSESGLIIDEFLEQCSADNECDYVLISGDFVSGLVSETPESLVDEVVKKFNAFEEKTGKDIFVIDGNHDVDFNNHSTVDSFKRRFANFGYDKALEIDEKSCSYTADLGKQYRLIAVDSCDGAMSYINGTISAERSAWVKNQVINANNDGRYPIVMIHYGLLNHTTLHKTKELKFSNSYDTTLAGELADLGVKIVLSGHEHCSDATSMTTRNGNTITEFITSSLISYPLGYRVFDFTDEKITYSLEKVKKIDTEALVNQTKGYSDEQIAYMNEDLTQYSKEYYEYGMKTIIRYFIYSDILNKQSDNAIVNELVKLIGDVDKTFLIPLYGEGGLKELMAEYDLEIPDSNFTDCYNIALDILASYVAGEKDYDILDDELIIIYKALIYTIRKNSHTASDEMLVDMANVTSNVSGNEIIKEDVREIVNKVSLDYVPFEYLVISVVAGLSNRFLTDMDGIDDNNGELIGYGVKVPAQNTSIIQKLFAYFVNIVKIIVKNIYAVIKFI